jgi:hypothetical protein
MFELDEEVQEHPVWQKYPHVLHKNAKYVVVSVGEENGTSIILKNCATMEEARHVLKYFDLEYKYADLEDDPRLIETRRMVRKQDVKNLKLLTGSLEDTEYTGLTEFMYGENSGDTDALRAIIKDKLGWL